MTWVTSKTRVRKHVKQLNHPHSAPLVFGLAARAAPWMTKSEHAELRLSWSLGKTGVRCFGRYREISFELPFEQSVLESLMEALSRHGGLSSAGAPFWPQLADALQLVCYEPPEAELL